jgi:alkylation response protein AidB-like acyl-CoA dehydrogenase
MTGIARDDIGSEPVMRLVASDEEKMLRESVAQIGRSFGHAYYMQQVRERGSAAEMWETLGKQGFLGVCLPAEYGGGGQSLWTLMIVAEELAAAGCPMVPLVFSQAICGQLIAKYGTTEQKDAWLEGIASGGQRFSFAITEPDAGSNSHKISTVAEKVGDEWVLRGTKTFISGVENADQIVVWRGPAGAPTGAACCRCSLSNPTPKDYSANTFRRPSTSPSNSGHCSSTGSKSAPIDL